MEQDVWKLLPRKSTRATPNNTIIDSLWGSRDELAKADAKKKPLETESKEESTKKHRAQKQAVAGKETKGKGMSQ